MKWTEKSLCSTLCLRKCYSETITKQCDAPTMHLQSRKGSVFIFSKLFD